MEKTEKSEKYQLCRNCRYWAGGCMVPIYDNGIYYCGVDQSEDGSCYLFEEKQ